MMQEILVYFLVAAAALYLWRSFSQTAKSGGCGGCVKNKSCSSSKAAAPPAAKPLVQIQLTPVASSSSKNLPQSSRRQP